MTESNKLIETRYDVSLGHTHVSVIGRSESDALAKAKARLCAEMPRLWDVIEKLDPRRFVIVVTE
jgi:hypothetical protein